MANKKIVDLTQDSAPDPTDETITVDAPAGSAINKKVTWKDAVEAGMSTASVTMTGAVQADDFRINEAVAITSTSTEINKLDGFTGAYTDLNYAADLNATGVTDTEFDTLDGITATTAELNKLSGASANVTAANLNTLTAGVSSDADALHTHDSFGVSSVVATITSEVQVSNTTDETTLISGTVTGGLLDTAGSIVGKICISNLLNNRGAATEYTFRLKYGSTTVATVVIDYTDVAWQRSGYIDFALMGAGVTNSQVGYISVFTNKQIGLGATADTYAFERDPGTAAEDSTGDLTLSVTIQLEAASASTRLYADMGYAILTS